MRLMARKVDVAAVPQRMRYERRLTALKTERQSWDAHWKELAEHIQPRRSRFFQSERNKGDKKNATIINGTPTWAARVLSSGMMAGITSPARPWFRIATPDSDLNEFSAVKEWLHEVEKRIREAIRKSNIYNALHLLYSDISIFGTSAMHVEEDAEDYLRAYIFPVGSYCLANSARHAVDSVFRELSLTVGQIAEQFARKPGGEMDWSNVSTNVKLAYERGDVDGWIEVVHLIEPNREMKPGMLGPDGMPFHSCWYEKSGDDPNKMLRKSGYEEFPTMAPRWAVTGEDVYGYSPGMEALGDCKTLQLLERRSLEVLEKIVRPPMVGPTSLLGVDVSLLPGGLTPVDEAKPGQSFRPAIDVNPQAYTAAAAEKREFEQRVKQSFFADLWLMLSQGAPQMTAREVAERHEEKMLQLGPVLERLQDELLEPLINRVVGVLARNGDLPPMPEELQGMDLKVEYISILADAQKLLGTTAVERLASFVGNLSAANQEVLDKLDMDQMVDEYGEMLGVPPALVRSDEAVEQIRKGRAEAAQQQMAMAQAAQTAQSAKVLSETDVEGPNALTKMLKGMGGVAATASGTVQ